MNSSAGLLEIDQDELRLLDRMGGDGRWVLSAILSLDLPEVPTGRIRAVELHSRLTEAEGQLQGDVDEPAETALESCLERVRDQLESAVVDDHDVHGVAFFCEEGGELRAYALRRAMDYAVAASFRQGPALEPLLEAMPGPSWGVALVSRKHGRVFRGSDTGLVEVGDVDDDVHRWHSQGGWSQGRYQRGIEKETEDHVRRVCNRLFALHSRRPVEHVAVLAPAELLPRVEADLHPYLRERLAGHVAVDVENATADQVLEQVSGLMAEQRQSRRREAVEALEQGLGTGDEAVSGRSEVLAAIEQKRVGTLLVAGGSRDDEEIERAVQGAVAQSAEVLVYDGDDLDRFGQIAALLRY